MYEYLIGDFIIIIGWLIIFFLSPKLRKKIWYNGIWYAGLLVFLFIFVRILSYFIKMTWRYVPDYFNPNTLFNLSRMTGGLAIEDILFMIFTAGIVAVISELFLKYKFKKSKIRYKRLSIPIFIVIYIIIAYLFTFNPMYNLIISLFIGGLILMYQRKDLLQPIIKSTLIFIILYWIGVTAFVFIFPYSLESWWVLENSSGILIGKVPIEELFYAGAFGLMWGHMYEYIKGYEIKNV